MGIYSHPKFKTIFIGIYFASLIIYFIIGFLPAEATHIETHINIPSIKLVSRVTELELNDNSLKTPDLIVGSFSNHNNKTLLIGHSNTIFSNLKSVSLGDHIIYNQHNYQIVSYKIIPKSEVDMKKILKSEEIDTLIIMTCAGQEIKPNDSTHRLIIKALLVE